MAQALPQDKASDIWERATEWMRTIKRSDQVNWFVMKRLVKDCEDLAKTDAVTANLYLAVIYGMTGDIERAEYCLRVVEGNRQVHQARLWRVLVYANSLRASQAAALADEAFAHREDVPFVALMNALSAVGAVHSIVKAADNAHMRNEVLVNMTSLLEKNRRAAAVLDKQGLTQQDVTAWMDLAGEVMRNHHLQWLGDGPLMDVFDDEEDCSVNYRFMVWATPDEAAKLTFELTEKVVDHDLDLKPGITVSFSGSNLHGMV